ncbi:MAG: selenocysteine-specific translation elongation factor [Chloroflexota bacterium]
MLVIGTAGHVDHGKSTLIRAITGIDPDRLKEEKARQMTIDLGFAWFTLPDGNLVGVIDVPGHRDFIENMLAGVGGINAVLFVIAADEGVMPQTREHLAIIDLLGIPTGVIALTKIDLVRDPDWLDLVQVDILDAISGTVLDGVPIVPVSARTGAGLAELQTALSTQLATLPPVIDSGKPRLWIDRVFSVSGFGTVVTGTLLDGTLTVGQEIELQPSGLRGRIRGLQTHNQALETALPGSRVAVNISGIEKRDVHRGHLLTLPDTIKPSQRISARFHHLPDSSRPLRHNAEVKLFCGAAERLARVRLLDTDSLAPGANGWLQLELTEPLPVVKGDRYILRYPSPGETIGGGDMIQTGVAPRYRRNRPEVIAALETMTRSTPIELVIQTLNANGLPMSVAQLSNITGLNGEVVSTVLDTASDAVIVLNNDLWVTQTSLTVLFKRLSRLLSDFHKAEPLRMGIRPESLAQQLNFASPTLEALLNLAVQREVVTRTSTGSVASYGYAVQMTKAQRTGIERLREAFANAPYTPPSYKEAVGLASEAVVIAMIEWGELVRLAPEVLLTPGVLHEFAAATEQILAADGQITIKALRDRFATSRKYAQAILEYFDKLGITRRWDDDHVIGSGDWSHLPRDEHSYPVVAP